MLSDLLVQYNPDGSLVYVNPYVDGQLLMGRMPFNYVELELDFCANVAGVAPCTAIDTGDAKCFNTFASCNDTANFNKTTKIYRFCSPNGARVPVVLASNHSDIVTKKSASSYAHLNSTGTTTIKSGAGILRRVVINTRGGLLNTFTIYDNTSGSGTVIAVIDTVNGVSGQFEYGVSFSTGLTVVNATGTSADITVIYE